jgi:cytochrome c551/c552
MKMLVPVLLFALGVVATATADEPLSDAQAAKLMTKYNCQSCHSIDSGKGAPSFRAIAKKYSSDPSAIDNLEQNVRNGSSGDFGQTPMPPSDVPDPDLRAMINWILQLQP